MTNSNYHQMNISPLKLAKSTIDDLSTIVKGIEVFTKDTRRNAFIELQKRNTMQMEIS